MLFLLCMGIPFSVYWIWWIVLPNYVDQYTFLPHLVLITVLAYNVVSNFVLAVTVDPSGDPNLLPYVLKEGELFWGYCLIFNNIAIWNII